MTEQKKEEGIQKLELAGCVITNNEDKVLLLHRQTPERLQWETPGGKVEPGEDPILTAKREIMEELGVEVEVLDMLGSRDFVEGDHQMGYKWFNARIISGIPMPVEDKHDRVGYFSWDQLKEMDNLSANTRNLVEFHFQQLDQTS